LLAAEKVERSLAGLILATEHRAFFLADAAVLSFASLFSLFKIFKLVFWV
jgi:hypothetical protein